jgi:hypothetical protein
MTAVGRRVVLTHATRAAIEPATAFLRAALGTE